MGIGAMVVVSVCGWVYATGGVLSNDAKIAPNLMSGNTVTTNYGTAQSGAGSSYPPSWPGDAPQYPGGTVTTSTASSPQAPMESWLVQFTTRDSSETIIDFYKNALTQNGWQSVGAMQSGGTRAVQGTKNNSRRILSVIITESNDVATVIVSTGSLPIVTPI